MAADFRRCSEFAPFRKTRRNRLRWAVPFLVWRSSRKLDAVEVQELLHIREKAERSTLMMWHRTAAMAKITTVGLCVMAFALLPGERAVAQQGKAAHENWQAFSKTGEQQRKKPADPGASARPSLPNDYKLVMLIKSTIIAVNQANATGNYTLLRDLGSPDFQQGNNATTLSEAFAALRQRNLDLAPILFLTPSLAGPPYFQENGSLRLTGLIPSAPEQVHFDFAFLQIDGRWMLDGISLAMVQAKAPANAPSAQAAQGSKKR
ncbi:hypothetical protein KKP04_00400 [Rhodomicrobium sp. Az07]|uniref:hypothetical protein n=1 Tax=Rhodomicrobium sp. Az07 TaxID=2839034 RepID=UPI001BE77ED8|nr:hypothetical protein [Rhodomicrobium sp. Az07]MBT3069330.1 hypothetical protein [Rhodomicrobium sp. Az07]